MGSALLAIDLLKPSRSLILPPCDGFSRFGEEFSLAEANCHGMWLVGKQLEEHVNLV
jgi:hypothetical protein